MNNVEGVLVPFNSPLNDFQKSLIKKPYQESAIARGIAYAKEADGLAQAILSPSNAFHGQLNNDEDIRLMNCAGRIGFAIGGATTVIAIAAATESITAAVGVLGVAGGPPGFLAGLLIFEGVVICTNLAKINRSTAYLAWKARRIELMKDKAVLEFLKKISF